MSMVKAFVLVLYFEHLLFTINGYSCTSEKSFGPTGAGFLAPSPAYSRTSVLTPSYNLTILALAQT